MRQTHLAHQFVEFIPDRLAEGILYISQRYSTAAHKCCCGCGKEVITPIKPTDWSLRVEGDLISLDPSIGNWSIACRSHYWIHKSKVIWAGQMSKQQIEYGRAIRRDTKQAYFEAVNRKQASHSKLSSNGASPQSQNPGLLYNLWEGVKRWWNSCK